MTRKIYIDSTDKSVQTVFLPAFNLGVFFDGTSNNKNGEPDEMSNIGKLWHTYRNDVKDRFGRIYIRGVGSKKFNKEDKELDDEFWEIEQLGGAFGYGGKQRIEYALTHLDMFIEDYYNRNAKHPLKVNLDIFGFSRGAALARHFVNVIVQKKYPSHHKNIERIIEKISVRFLGIFDTVGSFFLPGNDSDPGYNFQVDNSKARFIYHITSEDELRSNFDLQSIKFHPGQQLTEENASGKDKWMIEESGPGVHSDIGGGYPDEPNRVRNSLAQIYLHKMYHKACACGVPLKLETELDNDLTIQWKFSTDCQPDYLRLMEKYKNHSGLRKKHLILREHERTVEIWEKLIQEFDERLKDVDEWKTVKDYCRKALILRKDSIQKFRVEPIAQLIKHQCFRDKKEIFEDFFKNYVKFRTTYIHISHNPFNKSPGMAPQFRWLNNSRWPLSEPEFCSSITAYKACGKWSNRREIFNPEDGDKIQVINAENSIKCYLKLNVTDSAGKTTNLPEGILVEVWDINTSSIKKLGAGHTDKDGCAGIFCFDIDENKPDIIFMVKTEGKNIGGINLPSWWISGSRKCVNDQRYRPFSGGDFYNPFTGGDFYFGFFYDFRKNLLGDREFPLILHMEKPPVLGSLDKLTNKAEAGVKHIEKIKKEKLDPIVKIIKDKGLKKSKDIVFDVKDKLF